MMVKFNNDFRQLVLSFWTVEMKNHNSFSNWNCLVSQGAVICALQSLGGSWQRRVRSRQLVNSTLGPPIVKVKYPGKGSLWLYFSPINTVDRLLTNVMNITPASEPASKRNLSASVSNIFPYRECQGPLGRHPLTTLTIYINWIWGALVM